MVRSLSEPFLRNINIWACKRCKVCWKDMYFHSLCKRHLCYVIIGIFITFQWQI